MALTQGPVAVLGIGAMGHGMARSALRAGIPTIVWNREPEATDDLAAASAPTWPRPWPTRHGERRSSSPW